MGYLRDLLLYLEPALLPELATYETEVLAGTVLISIVSLACESALNFVISFVQWLRTCVRALIYIM